jgi:hypothetical protein
MKIVLKLQFSLWKSCNFKTYPILFVLYSYFEHYINKGFGHQISHLESCAHGMNQSKGLTQNKKKSYAQC